MTEPTWLEELDARTAYVVRLQRVQESDVDEGTPDNAFAFILGPDEDNSLVVEGTVTGDGAEAIFTVWGVRDGRKVPLSLLEVDDQLMISHRLA
jgi:hypothetical protein